MPWTAGHKITLLFCYFIHFTNWPQFRALSNSDFRNENSHESLIYQGFGPLIILSLSWESLFYLYIFTNFTNKITKNFYENIFMKFSENKITKKRMRFLSFNNISLAFFGLLWLHMLLKHTFHFYYHDK